MNNIEKAIKNRDDFLEVHTELIEFQKEIDDALNKCNEKDRFAVLNIMIGTSLQNLGDALLKFKEINTNILNEEKKNES